MKEFEVIFLDDDKQTILAKVKAQYGSKVEFPGNLPTKDPINGVKYNFIGWVGEDKLSSVTENIEVYAKYEAETNTISSEEVFMQASLQNAEQINYNVIVEAGKKTLAQQQAIEKDSRTAEEIVSDIVKNGRTEVGQEINKDLEK